MIIILQYTCSIYNLRSLISSLFIHLFKIVRALRSQMISAEESMYTVDSLPDRCRWIHTQSVCCLFDSLPSPLKWTKCKYTHCMTSHCVSLHAGSKYIVIVQKKLQNWHDVNRIIICFHVFVVCQNQICQPGHIQPLQDRRLALSLLVVHELRAEDLTWGGRMMWPWPKVQNIWWLWFSD